MEGYAGKTEEGSGEAQKSSYKTHVGKVLCDVYKSC